jgi:hypothetical protein
MEYWDGKSYLILWRIDKEKGMAKKILDTDRLIKYKYYKGFFKAYPYGGKIEIDTANYESFVCSPDQARHIAKKLKQFADDIDAGR